MDTYKIFLKDLFLDIVWEVLYFPIWWYSRGLKKAGIFCLIRIKDGWRILALTVFFKSFFKPMYGQEGWDARALSIVIHFFQLVWRLFLMALWAVFWIFVFILWIALPLLVIWQLIP